MLCPCEAPTLSNTLKIRPLITLCQNIDNNLSEVANYTLIGGQLYHRGQDGSLRLCVPKEKYLENLRHAHASMLGGHFSRDTTAKKFFWSRIWWPSMFCNAMGFVKHFDACHQKKPPIARDEMPLCSILASCAFAKWGIDFVGPIKIPAKSPHAKYITGATNYLTK